MTRDSSQQESRQRSREAEEYSPTASRTLAGSSAESVGWDVSNTPRGIVTSDVTEKLTAQ